MFGLKLGLYYVFVLKFIESDSEMDFYFSFDSGFDLRDFDKINFFQSKKLIVDIKNV